MVDRRVRKIVLPLVPLTVFFLGWELLAAYGLLEVALFPPPSEIVRALISVATEQSEGRSVLFLHIQATLLRLVWGFCYGALFGVLAGLAMGANKLVYRFFKPLVAFIMPIPGIALAPLFMIWIGFGDRTIIAVGSIAMFFPVLYNVSAGVRSVDTDLENAASMMGVSRVGVYLRVYLPWTSVYLLTGLKLGLARCWRTIIAVELLATATWGLGFMVTDAADYLEAKVVFGGILLMAIIFLLLEKLVFGTIEKATVQRWGMVRT